MLTPPQESTAGSHVDKFMGMLASPRAGGDLGGCAELSQARRDRTVRRGRARARAPGRPQPPCWRLWSCQEIPSTPGWHSEAGRGKEAQAACERAEEADLRDPGGWRETQEGPPCKEPEAQRGWVLVQGVQQGRMTRTQPCPHVLPLCSLPQGTHI